MNPRILSACICLLTSFILNVTTQVSSLHLSKYFTQIQDPDHIFNNDTFLMEYFTEDIFQCVSSCMYECNLVVYDVNTFLCMLHKYLHYIPSATLIPETGTHHYGESCEVPYEAPCIGSNGPIPFCYSCFSKNTWTYAATPCILRATSRHNVVDEYIDFVPEFNMTSSMKIHVYAYVKKADQSTSEMMLVEENSFSRTVYTGIVVNWANDEIHSYVNDANPEIHYGIPILDPDNYTLEIVLLPSGVSMFADGVHLKTFNKTFTGLNLVTFRNQRDIYSLHVFKLQESCY